MQTVILLWIVDKEIWLIQKKKIGTKPEAATDSHMGNLWIHTGVGTASNEILQKADISVSFFSVQGFSSTFN